jgi:site-specific recombinase XerD
MTISKTTFHPENERIKRKYFCHLKEAKGLSDKTITQVKKSVVRFEEFTDFKDFKKFTPKQASEFKRWFANSKSKITGDNISKSALLSTINHLKDFFVWLSVQKGYRKITAPDIQYFNLSENDKRAAKAGKPRDFASLEQIKAAIEKMPTSNEIEKRNKAIFSFLTLTGVRVSALVSLKLKHIDLEKGFVNQDPNEVNTKFKKQITTFFVNVDDEIKACFFDWVKYLKEEKLFSPNDPLFPAIENKYDGNGGFTKEHLSTNHLRSTNTIDEIVKFAFKNAGLKYHSPHTFRNTLTALASRFCSTPEEFKAYSQNLGHEDVLTTFISYGHVDEVRQGEIIKGFKFEKGGADKGNETNLLIREMMKKLEGLENAKNQN